MPGIYLSIYGVRIWKKTLFFCHISIWQLMIYRERSYQRAEEAIPVHVDLPPRQYSQLWAPMRATRLLSRVLLTLLSPGRGVALQGPVGDLGMSNTEQLEQTVRDINRLEATLENALPANLRTVANASQNWSPLDEEQERQEAEVNAAVAAATQQERRATEQLAAVRAQAAAVGARRQVRRFVNAGMLSHAPPPPPSPNAQTAQQLALEAQEVCVVLFERGPHNPSQPLTHPRNLSHFLPGGSRGASRSNAGDAHGHALQRRARWWHAAAAPAQAPAAAAL